MPFESEEDKREFEAGLQWAAGQINRAAEIVYDGQEWFGEWGSDEIKGVLTGAHRVLDEALLKIQNLAENEGIRLQPEPFDRAVAEAAKVMVPGGHTVVERFARYSLEEPEWGVFRAAFGDEKFDDESVRVCASRARAARGTRLGDEAAELAGALLAMDVHQRWAVKRLAELMLTS